MEFLKYTMPIALLLWGGSVSGQSQDADYKYERNSLCVMMIQHPDLAFDSEIQFVFK